MKYLRTLSLAAGAFGVSGLACSRDSAPTPQTSLSAVVAPLELPAATDACYHLTVWNDVSDLGDDTEVWDQPTLCASQYGANNGIRFTGICDAQAGLDDEDETNDGKNAIRLVLNDIYTGGTVDTGTPLTAGEDYINPCPAPTEGEDNGCVLVADCAQNEDTKIEFNLTVMRQASLGFFDTVVKISDVFCAAKLDCEDQNDDALTYLHDPATDADGETAVLGFTCLGGSGDAVSMYLDDLVITCRDDEGGVTRTATVDPSEGPGNVTPTQTGDDFLFGAAVNAGEGFQGSRYWNVLLGIDGSVAGETCTLETVGTVSESGLGGTPFATPEHTRYPFIQWEVVLSQDGQRACSKHPLNGDDGGVSTQYTDIDAPKLIPHKLELQATCPCWEASAVEDYLAQIRSGGPDTYSFDYETDGSEEVDLSAQSGEQWLSAEVEDQGCYFSRADEGSTYVEGMSAAQTAACIVDLRTFADDRCATNNGGCSGDTSYCMYAGPGEVQCKECGSNADCTDPNASVCDTSGYYGNPATQNLCVQCSAPLFACPTGQWCNGDGQCEAPGTWFDYGTASFALGTNEDAEAVCVANSGHAPRPYEIRSALTANFMHGVDFGITLLTGSYYGAPMDDWLPVFMWDGSQVAGPWSNNWGNGSLLVCVPD